MFILSPVSEAQPSVWEPQLRQHRGQQGSPRRQADSQDAHQPQLREPPPSLHSASEAREELHRQDPVLLIFKSASASGSN